MTNPSLPYALCALTGAGVMLTIVVLVWHCLRFHADTSTRFIKYAFAVLLVTYIITGFSVTLLVLHKDVASDGLCRAGGFFLLFSTQEALWMTAVTATILLLWKRSQVPWKQFQPSFESHRWSLPIFGMTLAVKGIVLGIISFLPLTDIQYFDSTSEFYYVCMPLRLPGEKGWAYSTLIIVLDWLAIVITIISLALSLVTSRKLHQLKQATHTHLTHTKASSTDNPSSKYLTLKMLITLGMSTLIWLLTLFLLSISYFSSGAAISQSSIQWTLGYFLCVLIMLQPACMLVVTIVMRTSCFGAWMHDRFTMKTPLQKLCPKALESVKKLDSDQVD